MSLFNPSRADLRGDDPSGNRLTTATLTLFALFLSISATATAEPIPARRVAAELGLSQAAIERVAEGEVVVEELAASSDKDLSLALVALVESSVDDVMMAVDTNAFERISEVTLSKGEIDTTTFSLAELNLPGNLSERLAKSPDDTFYLSQPEINRLRQTRGDPDEAMDVYRSILSSRARAYWAEGDSGITPYAGKGRSPREDLSHANQAAARLLTSPEYRDLLSTPPSKANGPAHHRLAWKVQKGRDQAAPVLSHVIEYKTDQALLLINRTFYSGYDYDSMLAIVGVLPTPTENQSVVFYINHTYTAQVAGFGGSAKRSIGRKLMQKELVAEMKRVQGVLDGR